MFNGAGQAIGYNQPDTQLLKFAVESYEAPILKIVNGRFVLDSTPTDAHPLKTSQDKYAASLRRQRATALAAPIRGGLHGST